MKTKNVVILLSFLAISVLQVNAQEKKEEFKVYGNCGMCESRIEKAALSVKGVQSADWNVDTKMLTVKFNEQKTSLDDIHKKIASVGHDTDKVKADDATYAKMHKCCKYRKN